MRKVLDLGRTRQRRTLDKVGGISTVVGEGSRFVGTLGGDDNAVILGRVEGDCELEGTLVLEEHGYWRGTIEAENVVIAGEVEGGVTARNKLEVTATARIKGTATGKVIAIAQGAVIEGKIQTKGAAPVTRFLEKRTREPEVASSES